MKFYDCLKKLEENHKKIFTKKDGHKIWELSRSDRFYYNLTCLDGAGRILKGENGQFNGNFASMGGWEEKGTRRILNFSDAMAIMITGEKVYCEIDGAVRIWQGPTKEQAINGKWFVDNWKVAE